MNQKEIDAMTPADLLGLWSARRTGPLESPLPREVRSSCPTPREDAPLDDEAWIALWVDLVPEVARVRVALEAVLTGGLPPAQAMHRATMVRNAAARDVRTWRRWGEAWGLEPMRRTPVLVARWAIGHALDGIREAMRGNPPSLPGRPKPRNEEEDLRGQTADVVAAAEAKFPDRFRRGG